MRVEVQIRTVAMDFWASLEHQMRYKKDIPQYKTEEIANELKACADTIADTDMRMLAIREKIGNQGGRSRDEFLKTMSSKIRG
jgi:putative GTP pyrophosphokinase